MQGFGQFKSEKMTCIGTISERYLMLEPLRFLDTFKFLNYFLDRLVSKLTVVGQNKFPILKQCMTSSYYFANMYFH